MPKTLNDLSKDLLTAQKYAKEHGIQVKFKFYNVFIVVNAKSDLSQIFIEVKKLYQKSNASEVGPCEKSDLALKIEKRFKKTNSKPLTRNRVRTL